MFPQQEGRAKWEHGWETSYWWTRLVTVTAQGDAHVGMRETVERKLRLPWLTFVELAREMEADPTLRESERAAPLRLKLCSALRHLATGHSFDGLEESFGISAQTMRRFFWDTFLPWMMEHKYVQEVYAPRNIDELQDVCAEYEYAGFPGCCGSVDGVHVNWYGFRSGMRADFVGKEKHPTLVFGVTVDHRYLIMHVTEAHAGATNDKFVIRADDFHKRIMHTDLYKNLGFDLYCSADGAMKRYKGCYVLCDGGYGDWRNLISAFACVEPGSYRANWSHRVGSVRKDAECTFGVLKARFRVLTSRIYRRKASDVEKLFKVCCCLHNMNMRARGVRPGRGAEYVQATVDECALDDGEDLSSTNAHGERIPSGLIDSSDRVIDDSDADEGVAPQRNTATDEIEEQELASKTALQTALMRHWRYYSNKHRAEYRGLHPFVYRSSLEAHLYANYANNRR